MHDLNHELPPSQKQMTYTPAPGGASCSAGPSKGRSSALASALGVAEEVWRQGAPDQELVAEGGHQQDKPAAKRSRRRSRQPRQRVKRLTFRASEAEDTEIQAAADAKGVSKARFIAQAVHAQLHGRNGLDQDEALDRLEAARVDLARVGNNINQMARILNSGGDVVHLARATHEVCESAAMVKAAARKLVS
ncbi:plasmid mobilization protein [Streptomyces atratus]|uniref:plasmid mobilization protein n=1 Tax=Streptomyces atratus TaxID=1893 RepID=UPI002252917B|nr:plasmid mobilization relaxosome protein MobC [Streptomyces atratus]MCX5342086.1 MobC family plasmid mobilization relaxosome protein [Streptomyces atratus]